MCIIIDNRNGVKLSKEVIDRSINFNGDGFGFFDIETGEVKRMMSPKKMRRLLKSRSPFIAHCRYATVGAKNIKNVHPFKFNKGWVMQNGTIGGFSDSRSDSANLADLLNHVPSKKIKDFLSAFDSRFLVYLEKSNEFVKTGEWFEHEGASYSKENVINPSSSYNFWTDDRPVNSSFRKLRSRSIRKESSLWDPQSRDEVGSGFQPWDSSEDLPTGDTHLVAVYGTLKQGHSNSRYLKGCRKVSDVVSRLPYRLCVSNLPYLIDGSHADGHNVAMELYEVSTSVLKALDGLEGHPDFYKRREVYVSDNLDSTANFKAWTYFVDDSYDTGNYVDEFKGWATSTSSRLVKC